MLSLQHFMVLDTWLGDIDANHMGSGMIEREPCGFLRPTSGYEHIQIRAILFVGPQQMELSTLDILVPPHVTSHIFYRRRERVTSVELAHWIGVVLKGFSFHGVLSFSVVFEKWA